MLELVNIAGWCDACQNALATKLLIDHGGTILGWYCGPCGAKELAAAEERRKPRARCHFNESSNRQCLLKPDHDGDHDLPCVESSAHSPHAKGGTDAEGQLYLCSGHLFDQT